MPVKLKDVKGCLVEQWVRPEHGECNCTQCMNVQGFNESIYQMGEVNIGLHREKLVAWIQEWSVGKGIFKFPSYQLADAILSKESELIEVKK